MFDFSDILNTEFTYIPQVLSKYFGKYYSNALCNGCTWLFFIWYILHIGLDYALNEILRKMKYKEYNRIRLKNSLWYLGFYCTLFIHTGDSFFRSRMDVFGFRKTNITTYDDINSDLVMGFMVLFSFFLHSAFWEVMEYDSKTLFLSYILLCCVLLISFILRTLEVAFTLTAFISIAQVSVQSAKLLYVVTKQDNSYLRIIIAVFFGMGVCSFCLSYLVGVPLIFLIPFFRKIITAHLPSGFIPLTLAIGGWYLSEIGNSPLFKLLGHWLFHTEKTNECCGNIVECSLFPPRNDVAYNLLQLRKEIKEREERKLSLRRSSKKGVLVQTIKCMVSLKRKIHAKRAAALQDGIDTNGMENGEEINESQKLLNTDDVENNIKIEKNIMNSFRMAMEKIKQENDGIKRDDASFELEKDSYEIGGTEGIIPNKMNDGDDFGELVTEEGSNLLLQAENSF
ncbi:uncharacterized protein LOC123318752 [Coccinella septempunctata]|uniref:uncharacterized protein LOC123318752 n=1 Tax=Coccinella septempunctata TaxID=41139 RepID=UPI001D062BE6|nr:uncharacterized protein LOC123318752 [Coccinella septempunctata]